MSYLRLIKLLYIADRESLKETGRKITRDRTVAMKNGPVLSGIYDLIKGRHEAADEWSQKIRKDGYQVELVDDPGSGQLSRYEIKKLREVAERYKDQSDWAIVDYVTHRFQEWIKNDPKKSGASVRAIPLEDILAAVGRANDLDWIVEDDEAVDALEKALRG